MIKDYIDFDVEPRMCFKIILKYNSFVNKIAMPETFILTLFFLTTTS